ncbi:uncharacterized protein LOC127011579 [Drosophila biarmipes]|uniref:uncharacterized protein LOC127011579 n=1 Tax=Drosophila biarmipes TaxID=125945 RepID=UPI0021CCCF2B|nr:uncharacterized protein LOC127011579 [Drosophila biarmipes]
MHSTHCWKCEIQPGELEISGGFSGCGDTHDKAISDRTTSHSASERSERRPSMCGAAMELIWALGRRSHLTPPVMLALLPAQHKAAEAEAEALTPGLLQTVGQLFQWRRATQHRPKREPI